LVAVINLISALYFKEGLRKITKCLLMPALLVFYIFASEQIDFLVIAALVFSCAGDVLLIKKDKEIFFKLGLAAFLISHVFYLVAFLIMAAGLNYLALIISVIIAVPVVLIILKLLKASPKMKIPVIAYAVVIVLMSLAALQLMLAHPGFASMIVFAASLIYIFSDSFMAYLLFNGKPKYFNFITMLPYIIAQGGIIIGLVLGFGG